MKDILRVVVAAAALSVFGLVLLGHSDSPSPPDVRYLASDAHFMIGGQHIVIPVVAIRQPDHAFTLASGRSEGVKDKLQTKASDPTEPMKIEKIDLLIRQYKYTGEHIASLGICPLLKRKWSETLCRGQHQGLLSRLPEKFDLLDRDRLDLLKSESTVDGKPRYDQVKDMALRPGVTEISCDGQSRFCTAMVEVLPGLLTVWTVWSDEKTGSTAKQMADTQGTAIVQFVRRAIGPTEDPTLVNTD
jgi:hypothetical protein